MGQARHRGLFEVRLAQPRAGRDLELPAVDRHRQGADERPHVPDDARGARARDEAASQMNELLSGRDGNSVDARCDWTSRVLRKTLPSYATGTPAVIDEASVHDIVATNAEVIQLGGMRSKTNFNVAQALA